MGVLVRNIQGDPSPKNTAQDDSFWEILIGRVDIVNAEDSRRSVFEAHISLRLNQFLRQIQ
jgi:hypothetical protein